MLRMKEVYAVLDQHIIYATTKVFFGTKMAEGLSMQSHGVKMLSLVEKLEDLKIGLNNDTYIDVILQSLPPSYNPFIVNYNMNGLEKSIHELINMLVQYEATTHKSESAVLVGEASTSKAKGKGTRRWNRKKGKGKGKVGCSQRSKENVVCMHCQGKGHWRGSVHNSSPTQVLERSRKLSKDEMILRLGDGKAVVCGSRGMDVKTTFLNGFVEEEIFQPEDFTAVGQEHKVYRLQTSIYGLKQASQSRNTRFDEVIRGYDFIKNDYDPCIYKKISGSSVGMQNLIIMRSWLQQT
ncbi:UNVERIFIED_CONTAM: hypothetical protein Sradi_1779000 [Sesamum radiatum]|uniref:Reverse transcriptase Ty1/copia-type domain-containing protein n=1 Tax=Sesamum radiatum TaxID=300843 RepID=A0AAW2TYI6_SESRA